MADVAKAAIAAIARIDAVPMILDVVCRTTGMGFAAVARVTEDRWIACNLLDQINFGLKPGGELKVETTICSEIRRNAEPVVIDHVDLDQRYSQHHTPRLYGFQSYISMPIIRADGSMFGTLCAIDPEPRELNAPATLAMFKAFADLIATHLDAQDYSDARDKELIDQRHDAELREQFIAVLGHDLRNPLAAIDGGIRLLSKRPLDNKAAGIIKLMQDSAARMSGLIDSVLDFARGRLGGGIALERVSSTSLVPLLELVVAELQTAWPDRVIETDFTIVEPVSCDGERVAQLFSNLLANAITHGAGDTSIRTKAWTQGSFFELSVANSGEPIPPATMEHLFQPFYRNSLRPTQQGLGLGLYIASMIAQAHSGRLDVTSTAVETRFTFRMPID
ncbi:GAF domain-containing sensor histidine kinase [Acidisoma sp. L85]|uniref:GAF domain-containing sensor histidine kinase n=1 Tax=Acidisoma sp. L85 TaxID=1641850 RepID=UPI00131D966F|nr:GAF domain-containing sensor histidine kinase [Acidisoma sp. L85]